MGDSILKGISAALLVTIITLMAGMFWTAMGLGGLTMSTLVDIGLIASCVTAGYRTGKGSGQWVLGGVAALGYVTLSILLLALFLEVRGWGVIQVLAEGGLIGILAGAFGAGSGTVNNRPAGSWRSSGRFSSWGERYEQESQARSPHQEWDSHNDNWSDWDEWSRTEPVEENNPSDKSDWNKRNNKKYKDDREVRSGRSIDDQDDLGKRREQWKDIGTLDRSSAYENKTYNPEEDEWGNWVGAAKKNSPPAYQKAWWEEDVL
jgi:hypothetical protein